MTRSPAKSPCNPVQPRAILRGGIDFPVPGMSEGVKLGGEGCVFLVWKVVKSGVEKNEMYSGVLKEEET